MEPAPNSKRRLFWLLLPVALTIAALVEFCVWFRIGSIEEWHIYQAMDAECHPIWRELYFGRIQAGDDINAIMAVAPPSIIEGDMTSGSLRYYKDYQPGDLHFTSVSIEVRNGEAACAYAGSCTWTRQFFDEIGLEADYFGPFRARKLVQGGAISTE
ncbi:hypothetical protein [Lacipirellula limnantheis]|uniref:Uncharacterized protein n=1 Tax=Lacipirellula limnantheis TaxID=2528024 RepID=A0A517U1Q0_9BACT|nr:hypothetical protein [Lacipirellula limnantheis]QDT74554.1 hypothetical protein I41_37510 [Lacipirellula limnantheis]